MFFFLLPFYTLFQLLHVCQITIFFIKSDILSPGAKYCPYDYLRVYDGKDANSPVIGTFCGMGKFPYSIIGTSEDLFVEFVSSAAGIVN